MISVFLHVTPHLTPTLTYHSQILISYSKATDRVVLVTLSVPYHSPSYPPYSSASSTFSNPPFAPKDIDQSIMMIPLMSLVASASATGAVLAMCSAQRNAPVSCNRHATRPQRSSFQARKPGSKSAKSAKSTKSTRSSKSKRSSKSTRSGASSRHSSKSRRTHHKSKSAKDPKKTASGSAEKDASQKSKRKSSKTGKSKRSGKSGSSKDKKDKKDKKKCETSQCDKKKVSDNLSLIRVGNIFFEEIFRVHF